MTEPAAEQPPTADPPHDEQLSRPPFAPIFTLVNNTSTRTTHHPHVRYIFSDDDPDLLTQALAEHDTGIDDSSSDPALANRAMILDLEPNREGGYSVAWASSLSPSWAVLHTQLSEISPPSSDEDTGNSNEGGEGSGRPNRLMLRIEGIESGAIGSDSDLRISGEASKQGTASGSGSGSGQKDKERAGSEDYTSLVEEFERRLATLRKIVVAGEERRAKMATAQDTQALEVEEPAAGNDLADD
ncbi:hypothetical protein F4778DRAFT_321722 [Xylariomycetidae sp. FL2044]|nr:hypothetical protein F4778DRAFT_321722 [Xylariomycetidae sp. FL2044]